jgi:cholesterol oxidase
MQVLAGIGLGGGSLLYDGVSLRAPSVAFEQQRDGRRLWPSLYSRASLAPYYAKAEAMLNVVKLGWSDSEVPHWQLTTKRDWVFAEGCRRIGATALPLRVADRDDANEGWWNEGQRKTGRQCLTQNYLAQAKTAGVAFHTGCEVKNIAPRTGGGYVVSGTDHRTQTDFSEETRILIVAGGAIGSTGLLLRSQAAFTGARTLDPGQRLGRALSANGDYGVSGIVGESFERTVEGFKGKPMSSFSPSFFPSHQFILIPFYAAPLYLALGQFSTLSRAANPDARGRASTDVADGERDWGLAYKQRVKQFGDRMLTMGCLCLDDCEGEIRLDNQDRPIVRWPATSAQTESRWSAAVDAMAKIYAALGGEMYLDSYRKDGTVHTSHPLGGCRMTERASPTEGVVDPFGESLNNRNLFVIDGAMIPSALGANPSLTIAAVAELIADRLISGNGTESLASRVST